MHVTEIKLPCFDMVINTYCNKGKYSGTISSSLLDEVEDGSPEYFALNAIESIVLAHAVAQVDVESPAYIEGIKTALDALYSHLD